MYTELVDQVVGWPRKDNWTASHQILEIKFHAFWRPMDLLLYENFEETARQIARKELEIEPTSTYILTFQHFTHHSTDKVITAACCPTGHPRLSAVSMAPRVRVGRNLRKVMQIQCIRNRTAADCSHHACDYSNIW